MRNYLKLMRVHHYIKNLLVLAALACSGQFFNPEKLISGVFAFFSFCLLSSVVYIINDIRDKEKDRNHPTKGKRPVSAGEISVKNAWCLAAVLFVLSLVCNYFVFDLKSSLLLLLYFILNVAYSFGLKNVPIIDITILASGFLIRLLYGAFVTDIEVSKWLCLIVIAVAFYFSLGKRRNELRQLGGSETRAVLQSYSVSFLDKSMGMCLTLANVFYALWSMDSKTIAFYNNQYLIFTVPIVLLITMKYSMTVEGDSDGDPVEVLLHDKILLLLCGIYAATMFFILYI